MFYVMLALRAELRRRGAFDGRHASPTWRRCSIWSRWAPWPTSCTLDRNNRILVSQGLKRMRAGQLCSRAYAPCFRRPAANRRAPRTFDLGFALGPRLNAAGRLADMTLGIECLITDDAARALEHRAAARPSQPRTARHRSRHAGRRAGARSTLSNRASSASITLFEPAWHQGVIGIVAGRIKERFHRPVIAFAPRRRRRSCKGSGRSIPGLHLRDALDLVSKQAPDLILKFGGHAMAAGLTIRETDLDRFTATFEAVVQALIDPADLTRRIDTDGALESGYMTLEVARTLEQAIWGQGFPAPVFDDVFTVDNQRLLKERHLKLRCARAAHVSTPFSSIMPNPPRPPFAPPTAWP